MSQFTTMIVSSVVGAIGLLVVVSGWMQPAPTLTRTIEHLRRPGTVSDVGHHGRSPRVVRPIVGFMSNQPRLLPSASELQLVNRTVEQHVVYLVIAAMTGLIGPPLVIAVLQGLGLVSLSVFVPLGASLVFVVVAPFVVHTVLVDEARTLRADLRYQVSAYLDVVTMLLAGNTGYEGALEQAAHAGDGRLFVELRRRVRESGARGSSLTDALQRTGIDLGLDELEQVAATAALSAAEGAPVARTLAAKCATLRSALSTEQESEARLRTSRLTTPIVGMALIFMALVMYPALNFS